MVTGRFRTLAIASCIGMLLVLLAGALVTNTGSGRGCGDDWPLCNGKFIPSYTLESLIEYSHRLITGFEGLLVLAAFLATYRLFRSNKVDFKEPLYYAGGALLFTIVQALMGAAAVLWPQSPPIMAIHFGISLLAFAATLLLVVWSYRVKNGRQAVFTVPRSVFPRVLAVTVFCYVVVYLGAFIRHTESAGGCIGWPLCNGQVIPDFEGATTIVFIHRVAGMLLGLSILGLYTHIRRVTNGKAGLLIPAGWTVLLVVCQVLSGALLTATLTNDNWFIFTSLLHNLIITGLFGILIDMLIRSRRLQERTDNG
ncbi:COX15/CtaA family protein [Paenibacillus radicis (ex Gao et al. 2016)]|uniref:Heme A synthase n=1 Tax=Paenibacillus radicis (ex Gao et al. 2016) TaxID=1737354 RepID=A0A917HDZ4_9BACL|nr:COX15/CtaA family protein [Paenibacillus radicis (ex Gao et al. 2016)]GGG75955.1 heme A synthase [Paenibacillus radicis (ex Gao et al. 2016)]